MFITIEGGEGSGKTTLRDRLYDHFLASGQSVIKTREPGGTLLGEKIRDLLLHGTEFDIKSRSELFLFLADRAQHIESMIKPALAEGKMVICDRFSDSTIAYQGARGLSIENLEQLCLNACDGVVPDITFFIDLDPLVGLKRLGAENTRDRIEQEALNFHIKVRQAFLTLAERNPDRIAVLNGNKTPDEVFDAACSVLAQRLSR